VKKSTWRRTLGVALLSSLSVSCGTPAGEVTLSTIGPGYAATKVNTGIFRVNALVTHGQLQFAGYYSPHGTVVIASRPLDGGPWSVHDPGWRGNVRDAHNGVCLGISTDGILHVCYDMHVDPLRYRRSSRPLDPASFGEEIPMTGERESRVTYPQFVNLDDGTLLFFYRDGKSGSGDLCINRYDVPAAKWTPLQHPLISGAGTHNAYWMRPAVGSDGSLQLAFCWRRTPDASTNSRVCYAGSRDGGRTWHDSEGRPYDLPITPATAEVVDPVPEQHNLSNQDSSEADSLGRLHAVYRKNDADGVTQYHHLWLDGGRWRTTVASRFTEPYAIRGGGSLRSPLSRGNLFIDGDDNVFVLYRDNRQGSKPMVIELPAPDYERAREYALCERDFLQFEPVYDPLRWRRDGVLDVFVQATDQGNHETVTDNGPQPAMVLHWER